VASRHTHKLGRSLELSHEPVELPHVAACRVGEANHRTSRGDGCGESRTPPTPPYPSAAGRCSAARRGPYVDVLNGGVHTEQELDMLSKGLGVDIAPRPGGERGPFRSRGGGGPFAEMEP